MEPVKIYFSRSLYTTLEARQYLKRNNLYPCLRTIRSDTDYVYILKDENFFTNKITKHIQTGVKVVYGFY